MGLGGVAIAVLPSVVHLQLTFSDRLGGGLSADAIISTADMRQPQKSAIGLSLSG